MTHQWRRTESSFTALPYSGIKAIRAEIVVPHHPGGTLNDYVPFYFAPRSPMLYTIDQGNVASVTDGQKHIVHLVLTADELALERDFVFTDGHAIMDLSNFYDDLNDLSVLDWDSINSRKWGTYYDPTDETKRKKQSEFLVHGHVSWERVLEIATASEVCAALVHDALIGVAHCPPITVRRHWYY